MDKMKLYKLKEIAIMLGVTRQKVSELINGGYLKAHKLLGCKEYRISEKQYLEYLKRCEQ